MHSTTQTIVRGRYLRGARGWLKMKQADAAEAMDASERTLQAAEAEQRCTKELWTRALVLFEARDIVFVDESFRGAAEIRAPLAETPEETFAAYARFCIGFLGETQEEVCEGAGVSNSRLPVALAGKKRAGSAIVRLSAYFSARGLAMVPDADGVSIFLTSASYGDP